MQSSVARPVSTQLSRSLLAGGIVLALALGVTSCKKDQNAAPAGSTPAATTPAAPTQAVSSAVAAMGADQLRDAASKALSEQRLYAPAGNNAMEYYLALRDKAANDPSVSSALTDLQPYATIATEQAIARKDFSEADRLYALLEKTDSAAPALPRLKNAITDGEKAVAAAAASGTTPVLTPQEQAKQADLEKKRLEDQKKLQEQAAKELAAKQTQDKANQTAAKAQQDATAKADADRKAEADRKTAADRKAAADRAAEQQRAAPAPAASAPAPTRSASSDLRAISTPSPRFPAEALRSGVSGSVTVEFTVSSDGSVDAARVVNADPPRVFDREALNAVRKWRFEPVASPVTTRRTMQFKPAE
ncbi:energy transducer TonB [Solilutibacter silvestris]|uniref:Protein TonB n=1 Tax=Solilutibacter silvestris TaxID=1645665 RepID=A0A2K1Q141_9GAMM|nr:energy transducer TonB [Lysobacter silvestris]PNS08753.1 TonB protein [Lysobacter silvestris]